MNLPSKKIMILSAVAVVVVLGVVAATLLSRQRTSVPAPIVTKKTTLPVKSGVVDQAAEQPIDRTYAGDFDLVPQDFVIDSDYRATAVAQDVEVNTKEGYRVTLHVPPSSIFDRKVGLSGLKHNPIPKDQVPGMKGNGISVSVDTAGFADTAWLVFDFSPEQRTYNKRQPINFCRPDYPQFDVFRCLNQTGGTLAHEELFAVHLINTDGEQYGAKIQAHLVPVFKVAPDVYAVAVRTQGVYIPFVVGKNAGQEQLTRLIDMTADWTGTEATWYLEAARAQRYLGTAPGEKMQEKLAQLPTMSYIDLRWQIVAVEMAEYFKIAGAETMDRKLSFRSVALRDWVEYFATVALVKRSYPETKKMPDLFAPDVEKAFTDKLNRKPPSKVTEQNAQYYTERVMVVDAFSELWHFYQWQKQHIAVSDASPSLLAFLRELIAPTVSAQPQPGDPEWPEWYHNGVGDALRDMVNSTGCSSAGRKDLLVIAKIAYEWEHEDIGDAALDKVKGCLEDAIENATPETGGGGGSGGGEDGSAPSGGSSGCSKINKNLSNFGINSCTDGAGGLVGLAKEAMQIEEGGLANKALTKAGLL